MKRIILALILIATAAGVKAEDSQFLQLSLTPDIALHSRETTISGISLNIWGENPQHGFTLGFVNGSTGESGGFTMGLVNYSEAYTGVQFGFVNVSTKIYTGWQDGFVNVAKEYHGFQSGFFNYAESMRG